MFDHHRKSPWFAEKYDPSPEFAQMRMRVRKFGWKGRMSTFLLDLEAGKFDPELNEPEQEAESSVRDGVSNGEATQVSTGDAVDARATSVTAEEPKPTIGGDDEMQFNVEVEDEAVDQDGTRADTNGKPQGDLKRLANREEELSIPPEGNQVMIRTIPPDIGRMKLEEVRFLLFKSINT
jgi:hypothetical protein